MGPQFYLNEACTRPWINNWSMSPNKMWLSNLRAYADVNTPRSRTSTVMSILAVESLVQYQLYWWCVIFVEIWTSQGVCTARWSCCNWSGVFGRWLCRISSHRARQACTGWLHGRAPMFNWSHTQNIYQPHNQTTDVVNYYQITPA